MDEEEIFSEGRSAYFLGVPIEENPYPAQCGSWYLWRYGWQYEEHVSN